MNSISPDAGSVARPWGNRRRASGAVLVVLVAVLVNLVGALPAHAAVTVSRAELSGSNLRLEGAAIASRDITVDGLVMGRSDSGGRFRIERSGYVPPADCTVDVGDGSATVTSARLSGCTVTQQPPAGDTTAPTAPTGLTAALAGSTANLSWTASNDAVGVTGYRVTRNGSVVTTVPGTSYSDTDRPAGTYTYTVAAVDAAGNVSAESGSASVTVQPPPADTTAPTVPADLTATLSGTMASLRWTASTDDVGVAGYRITRNGEVLVGDVLNTFYDDSNRTVGTWTYTVAAVDGAGNVSAESRSASVTVQPPPEVDTTAPTVPANLRAYSLNSTIFLNWDISTDDTAVAGYRVTRDGTVLGTIVDAGYEDPGRTAGTIYTYTVAAFDSAGNVSAESNSVSLTVQQPEGLTFLTPSRLPDAVVGQAYLGYIVCSDPPGPSTFKFRLVSGRVPDGTRFSGNTLENRPEARVTGTPSRTGTFSFTVEVRDNTGATARRTFTITVIPAS